MEVTYLPFAFSSDASYADLPLPLLGAPVDIEALVFNWKITTGVYTLIEIKFFIVCDYYCRT
jgi:hypothetical protein